MPPVYHYIHTLYSIGRSEIFDTPTLFGLQGAQRHMATGLIRTHHSLSMLLTSSLNIPVRPHTAQLIGNRGHINS